MCPPRDLVHQVWGELNQLAALRLFELFLKQRTQMLQLFALALLKEAKCFLNDFTGIAVTARIDPLADLGFELGSQRDSHGTASILQEHSQFSFAG